ncbi:MAG: DUF3108 domain-containing protein [Magnetococcales bacterium]|nr:DUF3108 domain-containing protein [Magnetococcales bacterium]
MATFFQTLLVALPFLSGSPLAWGDSATLGAVTGEHLDFNVHWQGVPAGRATLDYTMTGDPAREGLQYTLQANLVSVGPVDWIYGVNDVITARGLHKKGELSTRNYLKMQNQGRRLRRSEYAFLRDKGQVTLRKNDDPLKIFDNVADATNDPISAFYHLRGLAALKPAADKIPVPVLDGERWYMAEVTTGAVDKLFTPLGWFQAFPLHPLVQASELFRQQGDLTVWVTDDDRRLPLRVQTRVRIGEVTADLIGFVDGRGESRSLHTQPSVPPAEGKISP